MAALAEGPRAMVLDFGVCKMDGVDTERLTDVLRVAAEDDSTLRIVHAAGLGSEIGSSMRSLLRMQHRTMAGTRRLFRAAIAAGLRTPIWVVTRGAQRVTDVIGDVLDRR